MNELERLLETLKVHYLDNEDLDENEEPVTEEIYQQTVKLLTEAYSLLSDKEIYGYPTTWYGDVHVRWQHKDKNKDLHLRVGNPYTEKGGLLVSTYVYYQDDTKTLCINGIDYNVDAKKLKYWLEWLNAE